ncbi:MAG: M3 family metallopeptidase [Akkermansiaceae bacterium]
MSEHPFLANEFHVRWSQLVPEKVEGDIEAAITQAQERIDAICAITAEDATYENTFGALDDASESLDRGWGRLNHLDSVRDNKAQRDVLNKMLPKVTAFSASVPLNSELWSALKAFAESSDAKGLDAVCARFVEETCAEFRDAGADLAPGQKARMSELQSELAEVTQKFSENVLDSTNAFELVVDDESRLVGLPDTAKAGALADATSKELATEEAPKWRFTLQHPSMFPVFQYADDDDLRRELYEGSSSIGRAGDYDNSELVWKIISLRQEKAKLLGFANFADLTLQRRMARNGASALKFVEGLHDRIEEAFLRECAQLEAYKAEKTDRAPGPLQPWETAYWAEKQRKELYDFNDEDLRPYFPVEQVMDGLFGLASRLFGISITPRNSVFHEPGSANSNGKVEVWDPEVSFYELNDAESGEQLGSFYADWHPRETKRNGAWMNFLETGLPPREGQGRKPHLGLICGNMTKPVGDKPALLTHSEVETIFHEFGHLLHQLLSDVPVKGLSGVRVPWDFVELPSQIMENFCWDRESLDFFARHHETGKPIPDELFEKLIAARNYMSATAFMRQLAFGKLDLELHIHLAKYADRDLDEVDLEILDGFQVPLASRPPSMARRFSHLFGSPTGYAAGYYSYKWAEVLDADAFTRFRKEGVLNKDTGRSFRASILSMGNSKPADELYRDFMGRDPELEPLLERSGLA